MTQKSNNSGCPGMPHSAAAAARATLAAARAACAAACVVQASASSSGKEGSIDEGYGGTNEIPEREQLNKVGIFFCSLLSCGIKITVSYIVLNKYFLIMVTFLQIPKLEHSPNALIESSHASRNKSNGCEGIPVPSTTPTLSKSITSSAREYPLQNIRGKNSVLNNFLNSYKKFSYGIVHFSNLLLYVLLSNTMNRLIYEDTVNSTIERINERDGNTNKSNNHLKSSREGYFSPSSLSPYRNSNITSNFLSMSHSDLTSTSSVSQSPARPR